MTPVDMKNYMKARRLRRRTDLLALSGNLCKVCGAKENLEFDHRIREEKLFVLSGFNLDKSWLKILEEHKKCDLLCSDCHKKKTKVSGDLSREPWNKLKNKEYPHGSPVTYSEIGCRCGYCREAKKLYRKKEMSYHDIL